MIRHIKVRQLVYNDVVRQFPIERQQVIAEVQISRLIWPTNFPRSARLGVGG